MTDERDNQYGNARLDEALKDAAEVQAWLDAHGDEDIVAIRVVNVFGKGRDVLSQVWRSLPSGVSHFPGVDVMCGDVQFGVRCAACVGAGKAVRGEEAEGAEEDACPACGGAGWRDIMNNKAV